MVCDSSSLIIEEWEEVAVLYHSLSGQTHQLNDFAIEALKLIQENPATISSLAERIAAIFEVEDNAELRSQIEELVREFDNLALIEAVNCEN